MRMPQDLTWLEELYACCLPRCPVNMHQFATWLEEYVTKLTATDEAGVHVLSHTVQ